MAQPALSEPERPEDTPAPKIASAPAEPATDRALWPTFMRRTLAEDTLHRGAARR